MRILKPHGVERRIERCFGALLSRDSFRCVLRRMGSNSRSASFARVLDCKLIAAKFPSLVSVQGVSIDRIQIQE